MVPYIWPVPLARRVPGPATQGGEISLPRLPTHNPGSCHDPGQYAKVVL